MTRPDYAARAAAGAAFLDGQVPGWAGRVDLLTLRLDDTCRCVLGQIGGSYIDTRDDLGLDQDAAVNLGFSVGSDGTWDDWELLDDAWTAEITRRRKPVQVPA